MAQIAIPQAGATYAPGVRWKYLFVAGGVAALLQLLCTLSTIVVVLVLGDEPTTAAGYFTMLQQNRLNGVLRMDFGSLFNVLLFSVTSFAVYAALRGSHDLYAAFATALVFLGVTIGVANHAGLSLIYLSDQYALATTAAERTWLLAAATAVIATNWWHSTSGVLAGIFLQGGMVLLSLMMLRGRFFSRTTAYTGLLANGFDLVHVVVGLVLPALGLGLLWISGPFYLVWFAVLGRDLLRLSRTAPQEVHP